MLEGVSGWASSWKIHWVVLCSHFSFPCIVKLCFPNWPLNLAWTLAVKFVAWSYDKVVLSKFNVMIYVNDISFENFCESEDDRIRSEKNWLSYFLLAFHQSLHVSFEYQIPNCSKYWHLNSPNLFLFLWKIVIVENKLREFNVIFLNMIWVLFVDDHRKGWFHCYLSNLLFTRELLLPIYLKWNCLDTAF